MLKTADTAAAAAAERDARRHRIGDGEGRWAADLFALHRPTHREIMTGMRPRHVLPASHCALTNSASISSGESGAVCRRCGHQDGNGRRSRETVSGPQHHQQAARERSRPHGDQVGAGPAPINERSSQVPRQAGVGDRGGVMACRRLAGAATATVAPLSAMRGRLGSRACQHRRHFHVEAQSSTFSETGLSPFVSKARRAAGGRGESRAGRLGDAPASDCCLSSTVKSDRQRVGSAAHSSAVSDQFGDHRASARSGSRCRRRESARSCTVLPRMSTSFPERSRGDLHRSSPKVAPRSPVVLHGAPQPPRPASALTGRIGIWPGGSREAADRDGADFEIWTRSPP